MPMTTRSHLPKRATELLLFLPQRISKTGYVKKIMTRFVEKADKLFGIYEPLGTFKAKIDIAHALGLYDLKTRKGLDLVRKIRNEFAHSSEPIQFDHEKIAGWCRKLDVKNVQDPDDLRARYLTYLREVRSSTCV